MTRAIRGCALVMGFMAALALVTMNLGCGPSDAPPPEPPAVEPGQEPTGEPTAEPTETAALPVVPLGLPPVPIPEDNPMTPEKVELGRMLYFDTRLSKDGKISCATCHDPKMAWTEHKATSEGIGGLFGERNSPTVINAAYATSQFWDGRSATLEEQALGPIENPIEMGHSLPAMVEELSRIAVYEEHFQKVFGTGVTEEGVAKAIAAFERTVLSGNSPFDKFQAGDATAMSEAAKRGWQTFQDSGCATCHMPPLFSNWNFYNAGVGMDKEEPDKGRMEVTGRERDMGAFRVPHLREIEHTWPYFHNGSVEKLEDAVALMAAGGIDNPNLSPMMQAVRSSELTDDDVADLVEFLKALSGEFPVIEPPKLP